MNFNRLGPAAGEHVLIIGGCGGIGGAIADACRQTGLIVTIMDLNASIAATKTEDAIAIDLRYDASIAEAFEYLHEGRPKLDHVVLASGYTAELLKIADMEMDVFDDVIGGNLRGHVIAARLSIKAMEQGSLTFLSTAIGQVGAPGYGPYGIAKSGLNALIRTIASEEAKTVIRANAVAAGPVLTPFVRGGMGRGVTSLDDEPSGAPTRFDKAAFEQRIPMGRLGNPDDIAGPVLFLMSDAARYITGQVLHVNGGAYMRD